MRHDRYVPILRTKPAEWRALSALSPDARKAITPCLEILPSELSDDPSLLGHAVNELALNVGRTWGFAPLFVDLSHTNASPRAGNGAHVLTLLARAAATYQIKPIFTVWLDPDAAYESAAAEAVHVQKLGAAIRLNYVDLDKSDTGVRLHALVSLLGLTHEETDIFVECGIIDNDNLPDHDWICSRIPNVHDWRRLIVAGGAFPPNLMAFSVGQPIQPRHEWLHWQSWALGPKLRSTRIPTFSDYTIQHAVFHQPPAGSNPSASIRWAGETHWVIMRGEGLRNKNAAGHKQYRANAKLLCEREEFTGPNFSFGDRYVWDVANGMTGPGTPTTWITAGVERHITLTAHQIASL